MKTILQPTDYTVIYSGDETDFRKKEVGLTLIDQLELSVRSLRKSWSTDVRVVFIHTKPLTQSTMKKLVVLDVEYVCIDYLPIPEFPIANKLNVGKLKVATPYILFLDCDTIIHRPIELPAGNDVMIAYDALLSLPKEDMHRIAKILHIPPVQGKWVESPAFEYYQGRGDHLVPSYNSGVLLVRTKIQKAFYSWWEERCKDLYTEFSDAKWSFYIEQLACCMTIYAGPWKWEILPIGYNFICTPRASFLKEWPKEDIVIEHYAGNNSRPSILQRS